MENNSARPAKAGTQSRLTPVFYAARGNEAGSPDRHARHGRGGRRHRLRRLHYAYRKRREATAGRDRGARQFHQSPPACRLVGCAHRAVAHSANAASQWLSRPSLYAAARRTGRSRRGAPADALPGGRRFRGDERDAAVGLGLVRQCHRHHAGDARLFSLGLGADRAAGGGLCGPAILCQCLAGIAGAHTQHERADFARRHSGARHVGGRDRQSRQGRLLRFGADAAVFPAGRARDRPRYAPQDTRQRRQSGGAARRNRASLRRRRTGERAGGGA